MFDVVPPNAEEFDREEGLGASRRRGLIRGRKQKSGWRERKYGEGEVGKRTVEVEWKLPARLRKPVKQQLQKERAERSRRKAVLSFDRRPIRTQAVEKQWGGEDIGAMRGVEAHMGDTYRHSKPAVSVSVPPYMGRAVRRGSSITQERVKTDAVKRRARMRVKAAAPVGAGMQKVVAGTKRGASVWQAGERDVPFDWQGAGGRRQSSDTVRPLVKKDEDVSFPMSFSVWPRLAGVFSKKKEVLRDQRASFLILLLGLGLVWGVMWNLQGAGRGLAVLGKVQQQAEAAVGKLVAAQTALADSDLQGGEQHLAEAEQLLDSARSDVDEAVRWSQVVLKYADVTGRVRSGDALLTVGQELTGAGQNMLRAVDDLQNTKPLVAEGVLGEAADASDAEGGTLVDGIAAAQKEFAEALDHIVAADTALANVKVSALPEDIRGAVEQLQVITPRVREVVGALVAQSDSILYLLGAQQDRQYLLAFANNHELRPIGGFIGTVGLVNMDRGQVESVNVGSVYDYDGQMRDFIEPPEPLKKIVDRWYMRDSNWFVNYPVTARKMAEFYEKEGGSTVDGVVLVTPDVIERLLRLTGPVVVPGYDVVVSADTFREIAQSEVTYDYDPELNRPKQFLADLTPLLLKQVIAGDDSVGGEVKLLAALGESISRREMLVYFRDEDAQKSLADLGWDGSLPVDKQGFLAVNTANIGGHKSDQFVQQEIDYRSVLVKGGEVEVTVTIRREHRGPQEMPDIEYPEGENPAKKANVVYQRVLVPKGAELLEASGWTNGADVPQRVIAAADLPLRFDAELAAWQSSQSEGVEGVDVGAEAGYAFFGNWMITEPGATSVGLLRYRLPAVQLPGWLHPATTYQTYVYKQPGDERTSLRSSIEVPTGYSITHSVPGDGAVQEQTRAVWEGDLQSDVAMGVVVESQ